MCCSLIYNANLIGMCIFQHILKMTTKLHHCCVMYKKKSGMHNQLSATTGMYYKLDICMYAKIVCCSKFTQKTSTCELCPSSLCPSAFQKQLATGQKLGLSGTKLTTVGIEAITSCNEYVWISHTQDIPIYQ